MDDKYRVIYGGHLKAGTDPEVLVRELSRLFNVRENDAYGLLSTGHPVTLKTNLDSVVAERYRYALEMIGLVVYIEPLKASIPDESEGHDAEFIDGASMLESEAGVCLMCGSPHLVKQVCLSCGMDNKELKDAVNKRHKRYTFMLSVARTLRLVFPPFNQLTVFVIAVSLYTAYICLDFIPTPFDLIHEFVNYTWRNASTFIDILLMLGAIALFTIIVLLYSIGPLMMPFTSLDLRILCWPVVGTFVVVSFVYTISSYLNGPHGVMHKLALAYSVSWLAYLVLVIRFIEERGFVINDEKPSRMATIFAAAASCLFIVAANKYYSTTWHAAFLYGVVLSSSLVAWATKVLETVSNLRKIKVS